MANRSIQDNIDVPVVPLEWIVREDEIFFVVSKVETLDIKRRHVY